MPKKVTFSAFLLELRFPYLVGTSFLIFGLIYGAFEIFEFTVNVRLDARTMSYLHFTRGVLTTVALLGWIAWTLYEYRAKFQQVVRQHDDQFVRILDNTSEAVVVTDANHKITFWNKAASAILGWKREEVVGFSITTILRLPAVAAIAPHGNQEIEIEVRDKSGKNRFLSVSVNTLQDENSRPESHTYLMRDLTERAIRQAQMERNERLASLGHMAAGVAHEIGNPLTAISSVIQLLQRRIQDPVQLRQLERVRENISRITKIVRDLVDFSRPASPEVSRLNVNDPIRDSIGLLRHDARCRNVDFQLQLQPDLPTIQAVPDHFYQVMLNLLLNAVDATAETTKPVIRISTLVVSGQIEIAVNDNGPGIPASVKSQIFEPFFTTKQVGKGTGLGLAVSHTIISGMGGTLEADSVPGNTTFKISIPIQK
ncbi:MAG: Histidine kinase-, DNA gyrase B-, and HSP90-like ATPase [Bacteroidetes bacterium HLUCCA01]|nr:MAG: Histidine kinase-, DNA gyrase B-, and HSP90-like ATPase [Bacteroidetes bacterium HLUCCA01]